MRSLIVILFAVTSVGLQLSFRFKPLIGGPAFLPIHIIAQVSSSSTRSSGSFAELDFVPKDPTEASTLALLQGASVRGLIRKKMVNIVDDDKVDGSSSGGRNYDESLSALCDTLLLSVADSCDEQNLSLLSNNCYHFAYYTYKAVEAYNSANGKQE